MTRTCGARCRPSAARGELDDLTRQVQGRTGSLARRFDRVLRLLEAWGYLDGWSLTARGRCSPAPTTSPICSWPRR